MKKIYWFHGALFVGTEQRSAVVIAHSAAHAIRMISSSGVSRRNVSPSEIRNYWHKAHPREYANLKPDAAIGIYLAADMNYPRDYKPLPPARAG